MSDQEQPTAGEPPYRVTLRRALLPHIWLNEGRPLLAWRWMRFDDRPAQARWLYTYRAEVGLIWLALLLVLFWVITDLGHLSPVATRLAETLAGFWLLYGLILNRAVRWVTPDLPPPTGKRRRHGGNES